jgi:hypothetical protein
MDWIRLAQGRVQWWSVVNTVRIENSYSTIGMEFLVYLIDY